MSPRVSSTEAIRAEIDALFTGDRDLAEVLEDVARLGVRLIIQTAMEAEIDALLGRVRYQCQATTVAPEGLVRAVAGGRPRRSATALRAAPVGDSLATFSRPYDQLSRGILSLLMNTTLRVNV